MPFGLGHSLSLQCLQWVMTRAGLCQSLSWDTKLLLCGLHLPCRDKHLASFPDLFECSLSIFSSSHVWMWELDYKESWALKNWCYWTVVLEKTLESPLDCKGIQPVHPKGNQSWISLKGLMLKLKLQYFGHLMQRTESFEKEPDAGKDWRWEEKGTTEDEMVGWQHWLNGHEFE